jgi:hypothetical protein
MAEFFRWTSAPWEFELVFKAVCILLADRLANRPSFELLKTISGNAEGLVSKIFSYNKENISENAHAELGNVLQELATLSAELFIHQRAGAALYEWVLCMHEYKCIQDESLDLRTKNLETLIYDYSYSFYWPDFFETEVVMAKANEDNILELDAIAENKIDLKSFKFAAIDECMTVVDSKISAAKIQNNKHLFIFSQKFLTAEAANVTLCFIKKYNFYLLTFDYW